MLVPDYKYLDSSSNTVKNIETLIRGSIPRATNTIFSISGQSATKTYRLTPKIASDGTRGLHLINLDSPDEEWSKTIYEESRSNTIVPPFVVFELQAAGGGGGSSSLELSRNGSGGGGGGFLTGVLKLDFNKYDAYDFTIGGSGRGGYESNPNLFYMGDGGDGETSYIKGVEIGSSGEELYTTIATIKGGDGGYCANDTD